MRVLMGVDYDIQESSGDVVVEATGRDAGGALVGLARGLADVLTAGSPIGGDVAQEIDVTGPDRDLVVSRYVNELVFLFETRGFLASDGRLEVVEDSTQIRITGTLRGETFSPSRHGWGTGVKSATLHGTAWGRVGKRWQARVLLDL